MKSIGIQFAIVLIFLANLIVSSKADVVDDHRAKIDIKKNGEEYQLFKLIRDGQIDEVRKSAPTLNQSDKNEGLVIAALAGRDDIVSLLVENSADVNYKRGRHTPLSGGVLWAWACYRSQNCKNGENVVAILINTLADANEVRTKDNVTILQWASQMGNERVVELLIKGGAEINIASASGLTALHRACYIQTNHKIAEVLLKNKANVNAQDKQGWSPIHYATYFGYENTVNVLLKYNANQFLKAKDGRSAYIIAEDKLNKKEPHRQRILDVLRLC